MNGKEIQKVQQLTDDEWRGYLAGRIESLQSDQKECKDVLRDLTKDVTTIKIKLAAIPSHCDKAERIRKLEKAEAGRKAVSAVLFGAGGVSVLGVLYFLLDVVFHVF